MLMTPFAGRKFLYILFCILCVITINKIVENNWWLIENVKNAWSVEQGWPWPQAETENQATTFVVSQATACVGSSFDWSRCVVKQRSPENSHNFTVFFMVCSTWFGFCCRERARIHPPSPLFTQPPLTEQTQRLQPSLRPAGPQRVQPSLRPAGSICLATS